MNNFDLNIGLNVGYIEPRIQEDRTNYHVNQSFGRLGLSVEVKDGLGGDWGTERVMIVKGETTLSLPQLRRELISMCARLHQDAISYRYNGIGDIVFNESYSGEFYEFDKEFYRV